MKAGRVGAGQADSARHKHNLNTTLDNVALFHRVIVAWLEDTGSDDMWQGMAKAKLCSYGVWLVIQRVQSKQMRTGRAWVDTALLHVLGRAYGFNVLIA